jgi:nucleotide-binding universal stress UspA family protein
MPQRPAKAGARPRRILAAVDGSERTNRIVDYLLSLADSGETIEVVVLNAQPEPEDWRLRGYGSFKQDEVRDRLFNDLGKPIVTSVGRRLERAGISHKERVELGEPAEAILRCAKEEDCDLVLTGEPAPGPLRKWLARTTGLVFGSVAGQVVQLAETPVVIVK